MTTIRGMPETRVNPVALGSLLVFQNAGAVLLMRWVRAMPGESEFNTQTAVVMQEVLKGLACVAILLGTEGTLASAWALEAEAAGAPAFQRRGLRSKKLSPALSTVKIPVPQYIDRRPLSRAAVQLRHQTATSHNSSL